MKVTVYYNDESYDHEVDGYSVEKGGVLKLYTLYRKRGTKHREMKAMYAPPYRVERRS